MRVACPCLPSSPEDSVTVVTRTPLLATVLSWQFAREQVAGGLRSWQRPVIYSVVTWLEMCWQEARFALPGTPLLLSPAQETLLWRNIIEKQAIEKQTPELFDVNAAARLARRAGAVIAEWNISLESEAWQTHQDGAEFLRWLREFRNTCRSRNWITRADLWKALPEWIEAGVCGTEPISFVGFDSISPALAHVRKALRTSRVFGTNEEANPVRKAPAEECANAAKEWEAAARWARARFHHNPTASIGIFIPELRDNRSSVERVFDRVFYPGRASRLTPDELAAESVFHINSAATLHQHPLIVNALLLLQLAKPRLAQADACAILRSPFLPGAVSERTQRSRGDLQLRRSRELDVSLSEIEWGTRDCPELSEIWRKIRKVIAAKPQRAPLSSWAEFIGDLLAATGWPGDLELTPEEQDTVEACKDALSALAALGLVSQPVTYQTAIAHLRQSLSGEGVKRGDWLSPIQILDATDAAALTFDHACVTGLSDETWPPSLPLAALIPPRLQRDAHIPGSSPALLQSEHERLTTALFHTAPDIFATYTKRLSALAHPFVERKEFAPLWTGRLPLDSFSPASLERLPESNAPPFGSASLARGGTSLIKLQSLCPFRAFAEIRLRAHSPEDACFGFDARDRGGFLHKTMQFVWEEIKTQQRLKAMSESEVQSIAAAAVLRAVEDHSESEFREQTTLVERERLTDLVTEWLNRVEKNRLQPFSVETIETEFRHEFAGLPLTLRMDRIDRLANGSVLLIDYKSGKQSSGKLECPRPAEPQLLVYAAARGSEVDGVLFAEVRPREMRLCGIAREKHDARGRSIQVKKGAWDEFFHQACAEVEMLAGDFVQGKASVDPVRGACGFCQLKSLCRVNEKTLLAEEEA